MVKLNQKHYLSAVSNLRGHKMLKALAITSITILLLLTTATPLYAKNPTNQGFMFGYVVGQTVVRITR